MNDEYNIACFVEAQDNAWVRYEVVLTEMKHDRKTNTELL